MPEVKFCGMTRAEDARDAAAHGARYVGVIFATSTRRVTVDQAADVLAAVEGSGVQRVGVFGETAADEMLSVAGRLALDVIQLHGGAAGDVIGALRSRFAGEVWAVARIGPEGLADTHRRLFTLAHGVVLDTLSPKGLGGTGESFDWQSVASDVAATRGSARVVVAGGLRAENVGAAIEALDPDVVDVSSGVESAPGHKSVERMRAFLTAVRAHANR